MQAPALIEYKNSFSTMALILWLSGVLPVLAQSPYYLDLKRELVYVGVGATTMTTGAILKNDVKLFSPERLEAFDRFTISEFDRIATTLNSPKARNASDIFLHYSQALPLALLAPKKTRHDFGKIAVLWGEALAINVGLTSTSKYAFRRPRPFVYNVETSSSEAQNVNAQASFVSGHTSQTSVVCFFTAKVFSDYFPDSKLKPFVWGAAAIAPAITGYLRVKAGRHYPSDVIAGYALGAAVGILVPQLHKRPGRKARNLSLNGGLNGASLRLEF